MTTLVSDEVSTLKIWDTTTDGASGFKWIPILTSASTHLSPSHNEQEMETRWPRRMQQQNMRMQTQLRRCKQRVEEKYLYQTQKQCVQLWTQGSGWTYEDILAKAGPELWYQVRKRHKQQAAQQDYFEHHCTSALTPSTSEARHPVHLGRHRPSQHPIGSLITINHAHISMYIWSLGCRTAHEDRNFWL